MMHLRSCGTDVIVTHWIMLYWTYECHRAWQIGSCYWTYECHRDTVDNATGHMNVIVHDTVDHATGHMNVIVAKNWIVLLDI